MSTSALSPAARGGSQKAGASVPLLLDTHAWVWWVNGSVELPASLRRLITASAEQLGALLVTKDDRLRAWGGIATVWA